MKIDWSAADLPVPSFLGRREVSVPLAELVPYIDWTFFFHTWELKGRVPAIFDHPDYGAAARELYDNAQALLQRIVADRLLTANAVYGFWPANSVGDSVEKGQVIGRYAPNDTPESIAKDIEKAL